jgi:hypothetical protein
MRVWMVVGCICAMGCRGDGAPTFMGGGTSQLPRITGGFDSDSAADDSGTTLIEEDAPVIEDLALSFEEYPGIGDVITGEITWSDAQDDMEGGRLFYNVTGDIYENEPFILDVILDADVSGAANEAYIDSDTGKIIFALAGVDIAKTYTFTAVLIQDAALNDSAEVEGEVAP